MAGIVGGLQIGEVSAVEEELRDGAFAGDTGADVGVAQYEVAGATGRVVALEHEGARAVVLHATGAALACRRRLGGVEAVGAAAGSERRALDQRGERRTLTAVSGVVATVRPCVWLVRVGRAAISCVATVRIALCRVIIAIRLCIGRADVGSVRSSRIGIGRVAVTTARSREQGESQGQSERRRVSVERHGSDSS